MYSTFRFTMALTFTLMTVPTTHAQTSLEIERKFEWREHFGPTFMSGYIWTEAAGTIILGNGVPTNGTSYKNSNQSDFGVNIDTHGNLTGMGWGEQIGWVDFDTRDNAMNRARADWPNRKLSGVAWNEKIGWINLDNATTSIRFATAGECSCGDIDGSGGAIDLKDFASFATCFDLTSPNTSCDASELNCSDLNGDGLVKLDDYEAFVLLLGTEPTGCPVLFLSLESPLVGVTRSIGGTVCVDQPAPFGGIEVSINSLDLLVATVNPPTITIAEGDTCNTFGVTGVDFGTTNITADANGFALAATPITVTSAIVSLGFGLQLIPGQTAGLPLSLSVVAPVGGVTVILISSDPEIASVIPSVFIPAGQQIPAANPQVTGVQLGTVDISAETFGFAPDTREILVATNVLTLDPTTLNVVELLTADITAQLQVSAPAGGQLVDLSIDEPGIASVPTTVLIPAGENTIDIEVTGILTGSTTLRASSVSSSIPEVTATINVGLAGINLNGNTIGDDLEVAATGSLTASAPAGNLEITITSDDPLRLLLSNNATTLGTPSIMVTVNAGSSNMPTFYVHALDDSGSAGITATAPGYSSGAASYNFVPSGFRIWAPGVINTFAGAASTSIQIRPTRLNPTTMVTSTSQKVRGGISVDVDVTSFDVGIGTITTSPVTFNGGDLSANTRFEPLAAGDTTIDLGTPTDFDTPVNNQSITANVSSIGISITGTTIGDDLQVSETGSLSIPAPAGNLDVTITSDDMTRLLLSNDPTAAGSDSIIVTVSAGSTSIPTFYVYALDNSGSAGITVTAAGYGPGSATYDFVPSGFRIWSPTVINTTTFSNPTNIQIRPMKLIPGTLATSNSQKLRGGLSVDVEMISSDTNVGTISTSPLTFNSNDLSKNTSFEPLAAGMSEISIITPIDFDMPSNNQMITANVTAPNINISNTTVGEDLQAAKSISLQTAPPNPVDVTVTINDPSIATITADRLVAGGSIVVFENVSSTSVGTIYVQGRLLGETTITVQATGYNNGGADVRVDPSGFRIWSPTVINTTTFSNPTNIQIRPVRLIRDTLSTSSSQNLRGGLSVEVEVTSSDTNVGTITISPLTFNSHDLSKNTTFEPLIAGLSEIRIITPIDFDVPSNNQSITANVTAPNINISNTTVGEDLQTAKTISLQSVPPNPVDVTITINDSSIATMTTDRFVSGGSIIVFENVSSTSVGTIYVQGRLLGDTTITVQAAGYNDGSADVTVDPSGFRIWSPTVINTTTFSNPTNIQVRPVRLNPDTLNTSSSQNLRGGLSVDIEVRSSDTNVGTITISPLMFNGHDLSKSTSFDPLIVGTSEISIVTPIGFDVPSNNQSITANVNTPNISISDATVGEDLQIAKTISLQATPPNPVDVTITVNDPTVTTISTDRLLAGGDSVTFFGVEGTSVGTIYVQGRLLGNTFLTVSALDYNNGHGNVDVTPSGFRIWTPTVINTTATSLPTTLQIRSVRLDPVTLNTSSSQRIRGGFSVDVDVTSSDIGVGTITISPLTFNSYDLLMSTQFDPDATGMSVITVLTPPGFDAPSNNTQIDANVIP